MECGLRYHEDVIIPGAQTRRLGDAWPVGGLLGGDRSPAASFLGSSLTSPPGDEEARGCRLARNRQGEKLVISWPARSRGVRGITG
jgi:hypothetical protein